MKHRHVSGPATGLLKGRGGPGSPGTPVTFQRFTRRLWGWVGGFPQTSLTRAWGPRFGLGLWILGDSVLPGQSVPAVALGGYAWHARSWSNWSGKNCL